MLPRLVQIGPFSLYSFGLLVVVGFVAGAWLATRLARERGLPGDAFLDAAFIILWAGVLGARLLFVLLNWQEYSGRVLDLVAIWRGGMSFHGGLAAGILAGVLYMRWRRLPLLAMADAAAPPVALGYAIGRIGCFLNGCCYGGPTTLPWGVRFPGGEPGLLYHPAQIYASVLSFAITALLVHLYRRPHRSGQIMALYIALYCVYRFAIEGLRRGVTADILPIGLTEAQLFSIIALVAAGLWWAWLQRHSAQAPEAVAEAAPPAPAGSHA